MKVYTKKDLEGFERDDLGRLICPGGDYTRIKSFGKECSFGEGCSFGERCSFERGRVSCGRYVAVNLENYATIEFRLFRGTLKYKTFLATLQLVDEICNLAIKLSDKELESMSWLDFVGRIDSDKSELIEYLKAKRLYVNEPVEIETEVE